MTGREKKDENDLFFVCSVIENIGRNTKNKRGEIVQKLGEAEIRRLLELADVLHCEPIETTAAKLIKKYGITNGNFDNISSCKFFVPSHFDIAKVYKRLIGSLAEKQNIKLPSALNQVYTSWICDKIDDYNSSMFYENPQYLYESFVEGKAIAD